MEVVRVYYEDFAYGVVTNRWNAEVREAIRQGRLLFLQDVKPEHRSEAEAVYDHVLEQIVAEYVANPDLIYIDAESRLSELENPPEFDNETLQKEKDEARRLADLLVQDLEMFKGTIEKGIQEGNLQQQMGKRFVSLHSYYLSRVNAALVNKEHYFEQALARLVRKIADQIGVDPQSDDYLQRIIAGDLTGSEAASIALEADKLSRDISDPYQQVIEQIDPEADPQMLYDIALAYMDLREYDLALRIFELYNKRDAYRKLRSSEPIAYCYAHQGDILRAINYLTDVMSLGFGDDDYLGVYYLLGYFYERIGKINDAIAAYYHVYRLVPAFRDVPVRLERLGESLT